MPKPKPLWQIWEDEFNEDLGLKATIASGSKFYDLGDGTNSEQHPIPVVTDCKSTEQKSYSVKYEFLEDWLQKARMMGRMFLLPIRFENAKKDKDYVLLEKEDFLTLWLLSIKGLEK